MNKEKTQIDRANSEVNVEPQVRAFYYGRCEHCGKLGYLRRIYWLVNVIGGWGDWLDTQDLCLTCRTHNTYVGTCRERDVEMCVWNEIEDWQKKQVIKSP